jgi:hypothetical protein
VVECKPDVSTNATEATFVYGFFGKFGCPFGVYAADSFRDYRVRVERSAESGGRRQCFVGRTIFFMAWKHGIGAGDLFNRDANEAQNHQRRGGVNFVFNGDFFATWLNSDVMTSLILVGFSLSNALVFMFVASKWSKKSVSYL